MRATRVPLTKFFVTALVLIVTLLLFTVVPTIAARYVWDHHQAGVLALILNRTDAELAYRIGSYYFGNQGKVATTEQPYELGLAQKAFETAVSIHPSMQFAHYSLGRIAFVNADYTRALTHIQRELELYPENKRPLYIRALIYTYRGLTGDLALAADDFKAFVAWAPSEWAGYNDLAFVLAKEKKYTEAASVIKEGIIKADNGATNPWLWNTLGAMQLNTGAPIQALASFKKAQSYAQTLGENDWQRAYPGNNPTGAGGGLEAFKQGIEANIKVAQNAL